MSARPLFRISSMTKPIMAVAAMILVEECRLRLDDPDRRPASRDGEPARARRRARRPRWRHRAGDAADHAARRLDVPTRSSAWTSPRRGRGRSWMRWPSSTSAPVRPIRRCHPTPDEWMRRLSTLPLLYQPGERWLYNTGADVLGVLVARAAGQPLEVFLRDRVFEPFGMVDTAFYVGRRDRFGTCYAVDPVDGHRTVFDPPEGEWTKPPAFPVGGGWPCVDGGRPARVRADAARRRPACRTVRGCISSAVSRRDDHRPDRRPQWRARALARRLARMGLRRRRAGASHRPRARPSGGTAGPAGIGSSWSNDPSNARRRRDAQHRRVHRTVPTAGGHPGLLDLRLRVPRRLTRRPRLVVGGTHEWPELPISPRVGGVDHADLGADLVHRVRRVRSSRRAERQGCRARRRRGNAGPRSPGSAGPRRRSRHRSNRHCCPCRRRRESGGASMPGARSNLPCQRSRGVRQPDACRGLDHAESPTPACVQHCSDLFVHPRVADVAFGDDVVRRRRAPSSRAAPGRCRDRAVHHRPARDRRSGARASIGAPSRSSPRRASGSPMRPSLEQVTQHSVRREEASSTWLP